MVTGLQQLPHALGGGFRAPLWIDGKATPYGNGGLVAVLLKEEPFICLCPVIAVDRQEGRALSKMQQDGVRLGQEAPIVELDRWHLADGVFGQKIWLPSCPIE